MLEKAVRDLVKSAMRLKIDASWAIRDETRLESDHGDYNTLNNLGSFKCFRIILLYNVGLE
jgi:hypothetical protein